MGTSAPAASTAEPLTLQLQELPERRPLDKYRTPPVPIQALIETYPEINGDLLVDPCAGDCRMPRAFLQARRFQVALTNDIDPTEPTDTHDDAARDELWERWRPQIISARRPWAVSNTPFDTATPIVWRAIQAARNCAFLLRATWLEPWKDRRWLGHTPPRAELVLPRFSFIGGGNDSAGCRWYIWGDVEPGIKVYTEKPGQLQLIGEGS